MQRIGMALQLFQCDPGALAEDLAAPLGLLAQQFRIGAIVGQQQRHAAGHAAQVRLGGGRRGQVSGCSR